MSSSIEQLPDEILTMIFANLTAEERLSIEMVSRRWKRLALSTLKQLRLCDKASYACATIPAYQFAYDIKVSGFHRALNVLRKCHRLEKLHLLLISESSGRSSNGKIFSQIASRMKHLTELIIESSTIGDLEFMDLFRECNQLNSLTFWYESSLTPDTLDFIQATFKQLKHLHIIFPINHCFSGLFLVSLPPALESFHYFNFHRLNLFSLLERNSKHTLKTLYYGYMMSNINGIAAFENLVELRLIINEKTTELEHLNTLTQLQVLELHFWYIPPLPMALLLHDKRFANLIKTKKKLNVISLLATKCRIRLSDTSIEKLCHNCPNIEVAIFAEFDDITDASFEHLKLLRRLKQLELVNCKRITDSALACFLNESQSLRIVKSNISNQSCTTLSTLRTKAEQFPDQEYSGTFILNGTPIVDTRNTSSPQQRLINLTLNTSKWCSYYQWFIDFYGNHSQIGYFNV